MMASHQSQDRQLEKLVDAALKNSDFPALKDFVEDDINQGRTWRCSKQFPTKLDKLIQRELDRRNVKHACLGFSILHKYGKNLILAGAQGLSAMVSQGLVKKWFEKARLLWIKPGLNETLLNLAEDFFDSLMVVHETSKEGTYQVTESLLHPIGELAADPQVPIMIQKEAIRKLNVILDKIPVELKKEKKILSSQETSDVMNKLAGRILEGGDYDLQIALMKALCRMTTRTQRKELADHWFTMEFVASAFTKIQGSEFETDCRKFLNLVNGMQGDGRRVLSYPCLEVFLDKNELLMPSDEKLEEFWIDFNLGSQSISFYFSLADEDTLEGQWDTVCIPENEVHSYTVTEEGSRRVLRLKLSEPLYVSGVEGSNLTIHFSSSLDILRATRNIYGHIKNKPFVVKSGTSVVKTIVKIIMDESSSQTVVPESQVSSVVDVERQRNSAPCLIPHHPAPQQMVTPAKRKVSESRFIISSGRGRGAGASPVTVVMPASTPGGRTTVKPALKLVSSCERQPSLGELRAAKTSSAAASVGALAYNWREQRRAEVTGTMLKMVASYYETRAQRSVFEKSWLPSAKETAFMKYYTTSIWTSAQQQGEDVFAFTVDTPMSTGGKGRKSAETSAIDSSAVRESWATKKSPAVKPKRQVKKHLFSDTDTDAMTEVSWLSESSRKPKPKVTDYSRQPPAKPRLPAPDTTYTSPDIPPPSPQPVKEKAKPKKSRRSRSQRDRERQRRRVDLATDRRATSPSSGSDHREVCTGGATSVLGGPGGRECRAGLTGARHRPPRRRKRESLEKRQRVKASVEQKEKSGPAAGTYRAARRPQRAAASTAKNYREPDSASQSDSDIPPPSPQPVKEKAKPKKKRQRVKASVEQKEKSGPAAGTYRAARRPQRAAASTAKNYREPDSASQSDTEQPPTPKQKRSVGQPEKSEVWHETVEVKKKKKPVPAKEQTSAGLQKESWAARLPSFSHFLPAIERIRSPEKSVALPRSPLTPLRSLCASPVYSPPSPIILEPPNPPRSDSSNRGFQPPFFYSAGRKSNSKAKAPLPFPPLPGHSSGLRAPRPSVVELSPIQSPFQSLSPGLSPITLPSPYSLPLLTSTALEKSPLASLLQAPCLTPGEVPYHHHGLHFGSSQPASMQKREAPNCFKIRHFENDFVVETKICEP